MVTPLLELCHPQAALEAATQDWTVPNTSISLTRSSQNQTGEGKKADALTKPPSAGKHLLWFTRPQSPSHPLSRGRDCLFWKQKASPLLPGRSNATPNKKRFGMLFEAPLGLPTSIHPYTIKADIVSNNKLIFSLHKANPEQPEPNRWRQEGWRLNETAFCW